MSKMPTKEKSKVSQIRHKIGREVANAFDALPIAAEQRRGALSSKAEKELNKMSDILEDMDKELGRTGLSINDIVTAKEIHAAINQGARTGIDTTRKYIKSLLKDARKNQKELTEDDFRDEGLSKIARNTKILISMSGAKDERRELKALDNNLQDATDIHMSEIKRLNKKASHSASSNWIKMAQYKLGQMAGARNVQEQSDVVNDTEELFLKVAEHIAENKEKMLGAITTFAEAYAMSKLSAEARDTFKVGRKEAAMGVIFESKNLSKYTPSFKFPQNEGQPTTQQQKETPIKPRQKKPTSRQKGQTSIRKRDDQEQTAQEQQPAPGQQTQQKTQEQQGQGQRAPASTRTLKFADIEEDGKVTRSWIKSMEAYYIEFEKWAPLTEEQKTEFNGAIKDIKNTQSMKESIDLWRKVNVIWLENTHWMEADMKKELIQRTANIKDLKSATNIAREELSLYVFNYLETFDKWIEWKTLLEKDKKLREHNAYYGTSLKMAKKIFDEQYLKPPEERDFTGHDEIWTSVWWAAFSAYKNGLTSAGNSRENSPPNPEGVSADKRIDMPPAPDTGIKEVPPEMVN